LGRAPGDAAIAAGTFRFFSVTFCATPCFLMPVRSVLAGGGEFPTVWEIPVSSAFLAFMHLA
jgi:hypothetical protein